MDCAFLEGLFGEEEVEPDIRPMFIISMKSNAIEARLLLALTVDVFCFMFTRMRILI